MPRETKSLYSNLNPNDETKTGTIVTVYLDKKYDVSTGGSEVIKRVKPCPAAINEEFNVGDSVLLVIPGGNICDIEIWGRSNTAYPEEHLHEFSNEPEGEAEGTIYLCCPDEGAVRPYSLNGTAGADITEYYPHNICSDGVYLYCNTGMAHNVYKIKISDSSYTLIASNSTYLYNYGLAIDSNSIYLYTGYMPWEGYAKIARIAIADGTIEEEWVTIVPSSWDSIQITDLCGNSLYLFAMGNRYIEGGQVTVIAYDFDGNKINEFSFSSTNVYKIIADETNLYLYSSSSVEIYTIAGTFVRSISENNIQSVAVKDGKIYIVAEESGGVT